LLARPGSINPEMVPAIDDLAAAKEVHPHGTREAKQ